MVDAAAATAAAATAAAAAAAATATAPSIPGEHHSVTSTTKPSRPTPKRFSMSQIPESILSDRALNSAISILPSNYNFEIHKSVHRARSLSARRIALQFPEGLLLYSLPIADILRCFASVQDVLILGDPTYGACCVDDLSAKALHCDLLIHYGHSCLVPVSLSSITVLYVFVDVKIDVPRLVSTVKSTLEPSDGKIALAGTVQFNTAVHSARLQLADAGYDVVVPQAKPLSAGEVLGCTSPKVGKGVNTVVFVADGRFHLEAFMIANPSVRAFRYDPYLGLLFLEEYDHMGMKAVRKDMILRASGAKRWGIVLGTLGRQGSTRVLDRIVGKMEEKGLEWTVVLMSEISPARITLFCDSVDAWVQIACPRLSIDWGEAFEKPLLTSFELEVALGFVPGWWERKKATMLSDEKGLNYLKNSEEAKKNGSASCCSGSCSCSCRKTKSDFEEESVYPMDYYAQDGGDWNGFYARNKVFESVRMKNCIQTDKKSDARGRTDREADNHQLLQLKEKDVVSSVATVSF